MKFLTALALSLGFAAPALAGPNYVPGFSVQTGTISVKNAGDAAGGRSFATVECNAMGGGSCPDPAPAQAAPYENASFPNQATRAFSSIAAGDTANHTIAFFGSLVFAPGSYVFTVCVDASDLVAETNEGDNCRRFIKRVR